MQDFHMWVLRAPESGDAFFHRGSMWRKLDLAGLAISDYRSALKCNPSSQAARDALAELATSDRPKGIWSLAALFAGEVPAGGSLPSNSEPTASTDQPTGGVHE